MGRWIKLHSSITESAVWSDPVRLKAWIDLLIKANYKDKEWFNNGRVVKVKRGQLVTSSRRLSESWKCSRITVQRILKQFEELHMIRYKSEPGKYTLITIVKYGIYQDSTSAECATDDTTDDTTKYTTDSTIDDTTDSTIDDTQHKNNRNIHKGNRKKNGAAPPSGVAPDKYGAPPDGWTDEYERQFQEMAPDNPGKTRQDWYEFWVLPAEDGDDG